MYSDEKNVQVLLALLKAHGIRRAVVSPGGTNVAVVGSLQNDPYFTLYSAVDERHAAYLACGIALQSNEPVMLSCTGATASRNYLPALTEAFYRKLPILVVTSSQVHSRVGNLQAQVTDRSQVPKDVVGYSTLIQPIRTDQDRKSAEQAINTAILALNRRGGIPAHINLETEYVQTFESMTLPEVCKLGRIDATFKDSPSIEKYARIVVWVGSHRRFSKSENETIVRFVKSHNVVVLCDHTSSYEGPNKVISAIGAVQSGSRLEESLRPDLIIHIGEMTGDYSTKGFLSSGVPVWRVSPDGEVRDSFGGLQYVFEMPECLFFDHYSLAFDAATSMYDAWHKYVLAIRDKIPELPFSNSWIAQQISSSLPTGSTIHFAILNSLRSWNDFDLPQDVSASCNVGGFGIDGCTSTLIGASLVNDNRLTFLVTGDLAFFYDLNAIGNRHIGNNLRILLVNNGVGGEFYRFSKVREQLGADFKKYISADGHFGRCSKSLVRHMAEDLGFDYYSASDKSMFKELIVSFLTRSQKPIIFECFTNADDDMAASRIIADIDNRQPAGSVLRSVIPQPIKGLLKKAIGR